jgi:hypothetical protein
LEAEETDLVGFFIGLGFKIDFLGFGLDFFLGLDWVGFFTGFGF